MSIPNLVDLVWMGGYVSLKEAHDEFGVTGGDSWYAWYADAVGHDGHLADLMYEFWLNPSGGVARLVTELGNRLLTESDERLVVES